MKKKIFWIILAVLLVAALAVTAFLLLAGRGTKLYRNLDGHSYTVNTQMREKGEDGCTDCALP